MQNILRYYYFNDDIIHVEPFGTGHINRTFLVTTSKNNNNKQYIVQEINKNVFKKPIHVMNNIEGITNYIRDYTCTVNCDKERVTLKIVNTKTNKNHVRQRNKYWRCYNFIDGAIAYETLEDKLIFYEVGKAIGSFQRRLDEYPINKLHITIPNFHNTPIRYKRFLKVSSKDKLFRGIDTFNDVMFVMKREKSMDNITRLIDAKEIPLRVTHNDTKLNNVMIDNATNKAICLIDLDTVMPGSVLYDYGDALRVGASTAKEDETNLKKIKIDYDLFKYFSKGFLEETHLILTEAEKNNLVESFRIITLECGMRFLTDYLQGDTYFSTDYPRHNLDRARAQFKLVEEIEKNYTDLEKIIKSILKNLSPKS